jgi:hypothetical protein
MRPQRFIAKTSILIPTLFVMLVGVARASVMDQASIDNVQAAMRTLSFLESLSKDGPIVVGVVYPPTYPTRRPSLRPPRN